MRNNSNTLIAFSGPDGSGKSTIARKIAEEWRPSQIYWLRGTHTLAYLLVRILTRLNRFTGATDFYLNLSIPKTLRKLWQLIEFFSILPHILALKLLGLRHRIVCDRYLPDFIVWVALLTDDPEYLSTLQFRILRAITRNEAKLFYFTATLSELKKRSGERSSFLKRQLSFYEKVRAYLPGEVIDTSNKSIKEVLRYINRKLRVTEKANWG
ncbi:MAG: hypothetical protein GWO20_13415 [Candidatus Korarchaeota archaeon]|nr:hypothetical protein [Candidatus Korarchaeota archaeon]NIU84392.1 hypothetical protein [Candidatus Thorarchaeota archaeon]NIW14500.1 hypothetical protein [Candidatus Thorarchaeota archaeon]NIW52580.1 hypothetical protein [Candidatus Korarchaeota archaeon]